MYGLPIFFSVFSTSLTGVSSFYGTATGCTGVLSFDTLLLLLLQEMLLSSSESVSISNIELFYLGFLPLIAIWWLELFAYNYDATTDKLLLLISGMLEREFFWGF